MSNKRRVVWIDDNPQLNENERKVLTSVLNPKGIALVYWEKPANFKNSCGEECLRFLKKELTTEPDNIAGFILDVLIPVGDLSVLELKDIGTSNGSTTGIEIAFDYLINSSGTSPVKFKFSNCPILFLSIAPGLAQTYLWMSKPPCSYIEKGKDGWQEKMKTWVDEIAKRGQQHGK